MVKQEIIFVPYPTPGHILVTIEFAKSLIKRDHRIHTITILHWTSPLTPHADLFAKSLIASEPRIRLYPLPEVKNPPPFELFLKATEAYVLEFTKATVPLVRDALSTLVSSRRDEGTDPVRVAGLVLDFFCVPLIAVGNEFNLPSYVFMTCNASFLCMLKYLPERHRSIGSMLDLTSGDHRIPGYASSVPSKVLPAGQFVRESYEAWIEIAEKLHGAKGILVNSFRCLEQKAFDYFACCPDNFPPVYPVGPVLSLEDRPSPDHDPSEQCRIMRWLEEQPESSVVYLCFGSYGVLEAAQIEEIARALEMMSGHRFLWSIRTENGCPYDGLLPDGFTDRTASKGLVCGWAPQVEVLAHKAMGGFVSHCGWNSLLESLWFGVPIATWPMYAEQQLNAFTMVWELGLAVELRLDYVSAKKEVVKAEEIAEAIRSLMDGDENTVRGRVKEAAEAARKALMEGGSSFAGVKRFLDDLLGKDV